MKLLVYELQRTSRVLVDIPFLFFFTVVYLAPSEAIEADTDGVLRVLADVLVVLMVPICLISWSFL